MQRHPYLRDTLAALRPVHPVHVLRPHSVETAAKWFLNSFPGKVLFAVKTNPEPVVLQMLYDAGIRHFDVASLPEIQLVRRQFADASLYFMHPVKSREAIAAAYFDYGVRDFSLDCIQELNKILEVTGHARDLNLFVRLAMPNTHAELDLTDKFGVLGPEATQLLRLCRQKAKRLGVCFHVGSQCMHPHAYMMAMDLVVRSLKQAGVMIETLDIGGGFPSAYPGMTPPPLDNYMTTIKSAVQELGIGHNVQLYCEPGRALVAEAGSVVTRVELRKGQNLYLNDGTYGSLFDAGTPGFVFPVKRIRLDGQGNDRKLLPFSFYGPTCDSMDHMAGPFYLPADIDEGDYIEIGQTGAYGRTFRTNFNGFGQDHFALINDAPLLSLYEQEIQDDALFG